MQYLVWDSVTLEECGSCRQESKINRCFISRFLPSASLPMRRKKSVAGLGRRSEGPGAAPAGPRGGQAHLFHHILLDKTSHQARLKREMSFISSWRSKKTTLPGAWTWGSRRTGLLWQHDILLTPVTCPPMIFIRRRPNKPPYVSLTPTNSYSHF